MGSSNAERTRSKGADLDVLQKDRGVALSEKAQVRLWGRWQWTALAENGQGWCLDMEEKIWKFSR